VTQYLEVVPNAMGSSPPRSGGNPPTAQSGPGGEPNSLSSSERKKLDRLGPDGKTLANVVQSTAPPATPANQGASGGEASGSPDGKSSVGGEDRSNPAGAGRQSASGSLSSTGSQSAVSAVLGAAAGQGGGGGMGIMLPVLMGAGLLTVVLVGLRRRGARRP
jgi:hypothetical protein